VSHYWARFRVFRGYRFRFDTRIYLIPTDTPTDQDQSLGCIIGKNPGSASPAKRRRNLTPLTLNGDKFLPTVLSILRQAYVKAGVVPPPGAYVQVLNLFYLCNRDLGQAKRAIASLPRIPSCPEENQPYTWAWFAWGGTDRLLDPLKTRFAGLRSDRSFYYSRDRACVIKNRPGLQDLAKHTQGMPQTDVVAHLARLVSK